MKFTKSKNTNDTFIALEILQNGEVISEYYKPLTEKRSLYLSTNDEGDLSVPCYPLPSQTRLCKSSRKGAKVLFEIPWQGFAVCDGKLSLITFSDKKYFQLGVGDYASLSHNDLKLLIKVTKTPPPKIVTPTLKRDKIYKPSFIQAILDPQSKITYPIAFGLALSAMITIFALADLKKIHRPTGLGDLDEVYTMPFVYGDFFTTIPEAIQETYKKDKAVSQTIQHYGDFSNLLFDGSLTTNPETIFSNTIDRINNSHEKHRGDIANRIKEQEKIDQVAYDAGSLSLVYIPAVVGETLSGSIVRIHTKMKYYLQSLNLNLSLRRNATAAYDADNKYSYVNYKEAASEKLSLQTDRLSKIAIYKEEPYEENMYTYTKNLSNQARYLKYQIYKTDKRQLKSASRPIFIDSQLMGLTFKLDPEKLVEGRQKISELKALMIRQDGETKTYIPPATGSLDPTIVTNTIQRNEKKIRYCYEKALRKNQNIRGTMKWMWHISEEGDTYNINLLDSSISDEGLVKCIRKNIANFKFYPHPKYGDVKVGHSFEFHPESG